MATAKTSNKGVTPKSGGRAVRKNTATRARQKPSDIKSTKARTEDRGAWYHPITWWTLLAVWAATVFASSTGVLLLRQVVDLGAAHWGTLFWFCGLMYAPIALVIYAGVAGLLLGVSLSRIKRYLVTQPQLAHNMARQIILRIGLVFALVGVFWRMTGSLYYLIMWLYMPVGVTCVVSCTYLLMHLLVAWLYWVQLVPGALREQQNRIVVGLGIAWAMIGAPTLWETHLLLQSDRMLFEHARSLADRLDTYYQEHKQFPEKLEEVSEDDLEKFVYEVRNGRQDFSLRVHNFSEALGDKSWFDIDRSGGYLRDI